MDLNLEGKRALVTGSTRGIGLAIAKSLVNSGCKVVSNGRTKTALKTGIIDDTKCFLIVGDVTNKEEAENLVSRAVQFLGGLDILICNVGSGQSVPPGFETHNEWIKMLSLNFLSATNVIEACRNELEKTSGAIVCISSICGSETIPGAPITYSVAKAALNAYVRGVSRPFA